MRKDNLCEKISQNYRDPNVLKDDFFFYLVHTSYSSCTHKIIYYTFLCVSNNYRCTQSPECPEGDRFFILFQHTISQLIT